MDGGSKETKDNEDKAVTDPGGATGVQESKEGGDGEREEQKSGDT